MSGPLIGNYMHVRIANYGDDLDGKLTYDEFTGFTRGSPEDLLQAFGTTF